MKRILLISIAFLLFLGIGCAWATNLDMENGDNIVANGDNVSNKIIQGSITSDDISEDELYNLLKEKNYDGQESSSKYVEIKKSEKGHYDEMYEQLDRRSDPSKQDAFADLEAELEKYLIKSKIPNIEPEV